MKPGFILSYFKVGPLSRSMGESLQEQRLYTLGLTSEPSMKSLNSLNVHTGPAKTVL